MKNETIFIIGVIIFFSLLLFHVIIEELKKYFEKLDKLKRWNENKFKLEISKKDKKKVKDTEKKANNLLAEAKNQIRSISKDHDTKLIKLFFCPNKYIEQEIILNKKKINELIIDRDIYEYLNEVYKRLGNKFLFNDLMYFLNVRMVKLDQRRVLSNEDKVAGACIFFDYLGVRDQDNYRSLSEWR